MDPEFSVSPVDPATPRRGGRRGPTLTNSSLNHDVGIQVDLYRNVVFPNRIRQQRVLRGFPKLFPFSATLENIPYIRLSKIERGEVFAKAEELRAIADALELEPAELLLDVDSKDFDIEAWFYPFADGAILDTTEEAWFALIFAAAVRARRASDRNLTAATMARDYDISPVILSRLENAYKGLGRWNEVIIHNLCRLFGVGSEVALRTFVTEQHQSGALDRFLADLPSAQSRHERTRDRIKGLLNGLDRSTSAPAQLLSDNKTTIQKPRLIPVFGAPLGDGLIAMTPTGSHIEAFSAAGSRSYGVRVCQASLGEGLPGHATVIVDPDRSPKTGGLALIKESAGYRLMSVAIGNDGTMIGYSLVPSREVELSGLAPEDVASVIAAIFI